MAQYFISDTHFGHKNVLKFDNRNFKTIEEHDNALIENWNNEVGIDGEVYILGDISWHNATKTIEIVKSLNGIKHLIVGNHDKNLIKNKEFNSLFAEITNYKELYLSNSKGIVLCHFPILFFNKHQYGWFHLYGHVHNSFEWNIIERIKYECEMESVYNNKSCKMYNTGAMIPYMNYTPRTLNEILQANNEELME